MAQGRLFLLFMLLILCGALVVPHGARAATNVTLSSNAQTESTASFTWTESTDSQFDSYTLYRSSSGANGPWLGIWSTNVKTTTSTFVAGLTPGSEYWFYVLDTDFSSGHASSNTVMVTAKNFPVLQITSATTATISLSWTDYNTYSTQVPFDSYTVEQSSSSAGPWSTLATITNPSQTAYVATGLKAGHVYYLMVSDQVGTEGYLENSYSNQVNYTAPVVTIFASEFTIDVGQSVTFTSSTIGGSRPLSYQWHTNGNLVPSATSPTYAFSPVTPGTYTLYATVHDPIGSLAISNSISIQVNPATVVAVSASSTTLLLGQQAQFTSSVSNGTSPFSYQWYSNGSPVHGATASVFTLSPTATGTYVVKVTVTDSVGAPVSSTPVAVSVYSTITNLALTAPTTANIGDSIHISALLTALGGGPISGETVVFSVGGVRIGNTITDSSGTASVTFSILLAAGSYSITANYYGMSTYSPSSATGMLAVNPFHMTVTTGVPNARIVTVNGTVYATDASGNVRITVNERGTYEVGIVSPYITGTGTRVALLGWGDISTTNPRAVLMDSDQAFSISTKTQYLLTVRGPTGSTVGGGGWYDANAETNAVIGYVWGTVGSARNHILSYVLDGGNSVNATGNEIGNYSFLISMDAPHTMVFSGVRQFLVKVTSEYGTVVGAGWYDANSTAHFSVSPDRTSAGALTYYVFAGWSGDSTAKTSAASMLVDSPITVTANWTIDSSQLYLTVAGVVVAAAAVTIVVLLRSRRLS